MIALSLSAIIASTALAAFRVTSQTVTLTNRLSLENQMMRAGFFSALSELDFWDAYDNRNAADPTTNPLRCVGKAFSPLSYDPSRRPDNPKRWWRGFGFWSTPTTAWGDYSLLSKVGDADPVRAWLPGQTEKIRATIGAYGMFSYLPGDAIFCCYTASGAPHSGWTPKDIWAISNDPAYSSVNGLRYDQGQRYALQSLRPGNWPGVTIEVRRYLIWSHFIDACQVQMISPVTGEAFRFSFWGLGTTLRGARQQRNLDTPVLQ